jgi:diacylglycerol kinase (ATP)
VAAKLVTIAYNPKSGRHSQKRLDALRGAFGAAGYDCEFADSYSDALIPLATKSSHLCVVGGDGTLRDVIARISGLGRVPPVSVYPAGTINLVAREAGYPAHIGKFVARVLNGQSNPRLHYHGVLGEQPLLVCASVGPDSIAVAQVSESLKSRVGRFAYAASLIQVMLRWPRYQMTVTADGNTYNCEAVFVLKGRYFAGPFQISRKADLIDPKFQLILLPHARRRDYVRLMISAMGVPGAASKNWLHLTAQSLEITAAQPIPVQVDGDIIATLPVQAVIHERPVRFVT